MLLYAQPILKISVLCQGQSIVAKLYGISDPYDPSLVLLECLSGCIYITSLTSGEGGALGELDLVFVVFQLL